MTRARDPFFADHQPQKSSVFSIFDDPSVTIGTSTAASFTQASIAYTVITTVYADPLHIGIRDQTSINRLMRRNLSIFISWSTNDEFWMRQTAGSSMTDMRSLLHGSMFNIPWSHSPSKG